MAPYLGTERIPRDMHRRLRYLDLGHELRSTGVEIMGTLADLRLHLEMDHHLVLRKSSLRTVAKQHLLAHALQAID